MPPFTPDADGTSSLAPAVPVEQPTTTALGLAHLRSREFNFSMTDPSTSKEFEDSTDANGIREFSWGDSSEVERKVPVKEKENLNLNWGEVRYYSKYTNNGHCHRSPI